VLRFLTTEINYGGRVTDDKDRRLINALVQRFCGPQVLEEGCAFSPAGGYSMPGAETVKEVGVSLLLLGRRQRVCGPCCSTRRSVPPPRTPHTPIQFIEVISSYPLAPSPDIFGLHDNADITCEQVRLCVWVAGMRWLGGWLGGWVGGWGVGVSTASNPQAARQHTSMTHSLHHALHPRPSLTTP